MNQRHGFSAPVVLGAAVFGVLWFSLFHQLYVEWSVNEQYAYGWFVPGLALYLFWEAWPGGRPQAQVPVNKSGLLVVVVTLLFLLLPLRLFQEANPDWRPVSWGLALVTVGLTWCGLYARGGWAWWRRFAFATAFILIAVPWPSAIEQPLVRGLMNGVAACSVELLTWIGIPAQALGNVIALPGQLVGVDEACSGVRSLQTVIMTAFFLGELFQLSWLRRVSLLALSIALAFVANVGRAFVLVWLVADEGTKAIERWHDPIGYAVLVLSLGGVLGVALWLRSAKKDLSVSTDADRDGLFTLPIAETPVLVGILVWLLVVEGGTEAWYRSHENGLDSGVLWSVQLPRGESQFRPVKLTETETRMLRVNRVEAGAWIEPEGTEVVAYYLRWEPGRSAAQLAHLHRPEICLPSAGCFLQADDGVWRAATGNATLPLRRLVFDYNGRPLYVFYCLQEDRSNGRNVTEDWSLRSRWEAVAQGRRNQGQQVLEVILRGPQSMTQAQQTMERLLPKLIRSERQ